MCVHSAFRYSSSSLRLVLIFILVFYIHSTELASKISTFEEKIATVISEQKVLRKVRMCWNATVNCFCLLIAQHAVAMLSIEEVLMWDSPFLCFKTFTRILLGRLPTYLTFEFRGFLVEKNFARALSPVVLLCCKISLALAQCFAVWTLLPFSHERHGDS